MCRDHVATIAILLCLLLTIGGCNAPTSTIPTVERTQISTPGPTVIDRGLLYSEPCAPPCWEGITPGVSTEEDVVRALERLKEEGRIEKYTELTGTVYLATFPAPSGGSVDVFFSEDGLVDRVTLGYLGTFNFRVKRVIERFGVPEAVGPRCEFGRSTPCSCEDWDDQLYNKAPGYSALLLYPARGISVGIIIPQIYAGCVCPEMMTSGFSFYQPTSLEQALNAGRTPVFLMDDLSAGDLLQWHGYGPGY